jgi:hypothetical protein
MFRRSGRTGSRKGLHQPKAISASATAAIQAKAAARAFHLPIICRSSANCVTLSSSSSPALTRVSFVRADINQHSAASRAATMRTALTVFTSSPSARARPGGGGSAFQLIVPHFSKLLRTLEQPPGAAAVHQAIDRGAAVVARESPPSGPGSRSYSLVMRG